MSRVVLVRVAGITSLVAAPLLAAPPPAPPERIIDMHMHAMERDACWEARVGNPVTGKKMVATDEAAHREATFAAGKRILFGSDQMVWPEAIEMAVATVGRLPDPGAAERRPLPQRGALPAPEGDEVGRPRRRHGDPPPPVALSEGGSE